MNPQNSRKKSTIHENTDANITCDFGDGDISRSRSFLSTTGLNHATNIPHPTNINNPLNPSGVGLVNFFGESQSRLYPHMRMRRRSGRKCIEMAKWVEPARLGTELARLSTELARWSTELARLSTELARWSTELARWSPY